MQFLLEEFWTLQRSGCWGCSLAICPTPDASSRVASSVKQSVRANYSNPPRHGGAIVATILSDSGLKSQWLGELAEMRGRIHAVRQQFVEGMQSIGCATDFSFLLDQRGMFSYSGLNPLQVDSGPLKEKAIYMVGSGRINVAGMTTQNLDTLCKAINQALSI